MGDPIPISGTVVPGVQIVLGARLNEHLSDCYGNRRPIIQEFVYMLK